ncbi:MAG TPA: prolipoprotein diacylglyceryl transferase family protein [Kofleriaceae bacterium]|jgi:phosphatidylglycerol:prolipoprotein diacylglycerol transferase
MSLPYLEPPSLSIGVPIHIFGVIVTAGIMIGAAVMRRFARRCGESEDEAARMVTWVATAGFIGAHVLDVLFYRPGEALHHPIVLLEIWTSISSYGGFIGGGLGFLYIVWRHKLRLGRWADITTVGLLVAFSIGRAGCATVHDHVGAPTTSAIGIDFPRDALASRGVLPEMHSDAAVIRAHDLGLEELLYLIPVNVLVLWLAFRRRLPAGVLAAIAAALYAPVRFGLEHWRLASTDPPYGGLTFAQWCSLAVLAVAIVAGVRAARRGATS